MSKSLDDEYQNKEPEELVTKKYAGVVIPQILLDQTPDISWLKDMEINDSQDITQFIAQALQQTKLELNEKGVKVESAVAIEMQVRCCISDTPAKKPDYILDKPFMIAIGGVDSSDPNFMGYITPEDWVVA